MTFEEFVHEQLPPLLRFAKVLCGERALAEDVVQEVLARAYPRWDRVEQARQPEAYVRRMIVNEFLTWRRKWARVVPLASVLPKENAADHAQQHVDRDALIADLGQLSPQQRAVLVLRYYGGLTDAEIAADLDCAESTVRAYASRGLAALRVKSSSTSLGRTS